MWKSNNRYKGYGILNMQTQRNSGIVSNRKKTGHKRKKNKSKVLLTICLAVVLLITTVFVGGSVIANMEQSFDNSPDKASYLDKIRYDKPNKSDWNLILVNKNNPIPRGYVVNKIEFAYGSDKTCFVDERIADSLRQLFENAKNSGINLSINSAYRSNQQQTKIYNKKVNEYIAEGYSKRKSEKKALQSVAYPGKSEHETGLAVDIGFTGTSTWKNAYDWLEKNSYKYGFIVRYPQDKSEITGVKYEPWHFRYVGKESAKAIYEQGICLEEYLGE
ncbi:MAG: M15 family metallopeptidase [Oscillospiraceae bacterium]